MVCVCVYGGRLYICTIFVVDRIWSLFFFIFFLPKCARHIFAQHLYMSCVVCSLIHCIQPPPHICSKRNWIKFFSCLPSAYIYMWKFKYRELEMLYTLLLCSKNIDQIKQNMHKIEFNVLRSNGFGYLYVIRLIGNNSYYQKWLLI